MIFQLIVFVSIDLNFILFSLVSSRQLCAADYLPGTKQQTKLRVVFQSEALSSGGMGDFSRGAGEDWNRAKSRLNFTFTVLTALQDNVALNLLDVEMLFHPKQLYQVMMCPCV